MNKKNITVKINSDRAEKSVRKPELILANEAGFFLPTQWTQRVRTAFSQLIIYKEESR